MKISAGRLSIDFFRKSAPDSTRITLILGGGSNVEGPVIRVVWTPKFDKISAMRYPCRPYEKLLK